MAEEQRGGNQDAGSGQRVVRDGHMVLNFPVYPTLDAWQARAESLRRRILVSAGLWPLPAARTAPGALHRPDDA